MVRSPREENRRLTAVISRQGGVVLFLFVSLYGPKEIVLTRAVKLSPWPPLVTVFFVVPTQKKRRRRKSRILSTAGPLKEALPHSWPPIESLYLCRTLDTLEL